MNWEQIFKHEALARIGQIKEFIDAAQTDNVQFIIMPQAGVYDICTYTKSTKQLTVKAPFETAKGVEDRIYIFNDIEV
jgi:hypothetical protein